MDTSSLIHDFFSKECDECVHLVVDTTLNTDKVANTSQTCIFQVGISLFTNDFISLISGSSGGDSNSSSSASSAGGSCSCSSGGCSSTK